MVFQVGIFELNLGTPAYIFLSILSFGILYFVYDSEITLSSKQRPDRERAVAISISKGVLIRFLIILPLIWGVFGSPYAPYPESMLDILFLSIIGSLVFLRTRVHFSTHMRVMAKKKTWD